jgi:hypothetical protein
MPKLSLIRHPDTPSPVAMIDVDVTRAALGRLMLTYHIVGAADRVAIPPLQPSARTDELWKHTCFEAFIGAGDGYYEFNLAPSSQWAAYRFDAYRTGMRDADIPDPKVRWVERGRATLSVTLPLPADAVGPLGLSAVIEDKQGVRSFWALAHAPGAPDFHNAACFTAELPPAS